MKKTRLMTFFLGIIFAWVILHSAMYAIVYAEEMGRMAKHDPMRGLIVTIARICKPIVDLHWVISEGNTLIYIGWILIEGAVIACVFGCGLWLWSGHQKV